MATPFTVSNNFKNGGIRQGNVYAVFGAAGAYEVTSLGRVKDPVVNFPPITSAQDSVGRTSVIGYNLDASFAMMQNTPAEIEAAAQFGYPADGSPAEDGYNILFTDGPMKEAEVLAALNDVGGRIVPGILLEGVLPKPDVQLDFGINESQIAVTMDGVLQPDAFVGFEAEPVLTFA